MTMSDLGLVDRDAARIGTGESGYEARLVAPAQKDGRNAGFAQHGGEGLVDDTIAGKLLSARVALLDARD